MIGSTGAIIHRDIKPANIHLSRTSKGEAVKLLDFGLAKLIENDELGNLSVSSGDNLIGTPQFMAPERLVGKPADGRADIYSIGATLYVMLTGCMPFGIEEDSLVTQALKQINTQPVFIQRQRHELPDELAVLVMRMLSRRRRERPSLIEIKEQLSAWVKRWDEPWPPLLPKGQDMRGGAPLEVGETMNVSLDVKPDKKRA
jgi:serine/threonine protein kinase